MAITPSRLAELLALARSKNPIPIPRFSIEELNTKAIAMETDALSDNSGITLTPVSSIDTLIPTSPITSGIGRTGEIISYNTEQAKFIELASTGESIILIGPAGTGKTTCMRGVIQSLIQNGNAGLLNNITHKYLPSSGVPGIVAVSFTRRAVANLRRAMPPGMEGNCITIHKLLEYEPVYYSVTDPSTGEDKTTMKFMPTRHKENPLSGDIRVVIIDESSMVSVELFKEMVDALPDHVQFIFLGDIQQLPPVFGSAILGYKMLELETIELVQVYRQALESPIIRLAHRILSGKPIPVSEYPEWKYENQLTLHPWKKKLHPDHATPIVAKFFVAALESGDYNPEDDMILVPFNVSLGSIELNRHIANKLARQRGAITYEIVGGITKLYLSAGDKILYDREDAIITDIKPNPLYFGTPPQPGSVTLDYWGHEQGDAAKSSAFTEMSDDDMDTFLDTVASPDDEKVRKSSHVVTIRLVDTGQEKKLESAGEVTGLLLSYVLTVHKSQGSEWRKVFLILHQSHATMIQRELLYTAVTRAKQELYVICEGDTFTKGIISQKIKGNTLKDKAEYFKGKLEVNGGY